MGIISAAGSTSTDLINTTKHHWAKYVLGGVITSSLFSVGQKSKTKDIGLILLARLTAGSHSLARSHY